MDMSSAVQLNRLAAQLMLERAIALRRIARAHGRKPVPADQNRASAPVPLSCGTAIPLAPARPRLIAIKAELEDSHAPRPAAARTGDIFDLMRDQAWRAGGADPFTTRQKWVARAYASLIEHHMGAGLKTQSIETLMTGGGGGANGGIMDLLLDEGRQIEAMRAAAGDLFAFEVKRAGKHKRSGIPLLALVDAVCLLGQSPSQVLRDNGWPDNGQNCIKAHMALQSALDRMGDVVFDKGLTA